jgi:hypothetical protein
MKTTTIAFVLALACGTASAAPMKAVFTATVFDSFNYTNEFGVFGVSGLDGLTATIEFIYDPATSGANRLTTATLDYVYGGTSVGLPSPMAMSGIAIGGVTKVFSPLNNSQIGSYGGATPNMIYGGVKDETVVDEYWSTQYTSYIYTEAYGSEFGAGLDTPIAATIPGAGSLGSFWFFTCAASTTTQENFCTEHVEGQLAIGEVTVTSVSAVPLPASMPILVTALAALAALTRNVRGQNTA